MISISDHRFLVAAVLSSASASTLVLLQLASKSLGGLSARLDVICGRHLVLMHSFHECEDGSALLLSCNRQNFAILNVESEEFVCHDITLNMDLIEILSVSDVLNSFVVVSSPEERNVSERNHFSKHVKSGIGTLIHGSHIVLDSHSSTSCPVRIRSYISSCINIFC